MRILLNTFTLAVVMLCLAYNLTFADETPIGVQPVNCWFNPETDWPKVACFTMSVYENSSDINSKIIQFPVVKFFAKNGSKNPVLDLGGGGPGYPSGLDSDSIGRYTWYNYKQLSLDIDRDLYFIDPRGAGLAAPRMYCQEYIDIVDSIFRQQHSYAHETHTVLTADRRCRDRWHSAGHDISQYNSLSVAHDIETLRLALGIDKWNLIGVSYASRYALTYAREYSANVGTSVLTA